jgi:hypothetical protein
LPHATASNKNNNVNCAPISCALQIAKWTVGAGADAWAGNSVLAARNKDSKNHQVGVRKQQAICTLSGALGGTRDGAQMFFPRQVAKMFVTDTGQPGDLVLGEKFFTRLDGDHCLLSISMVCVTGMQFRRQELSYDKRPNLSCNKRSDLSAHILML